MQLTLLRTVYERPAMVSTPATPRKLEAFYMANPHGNIPSDWRHWCDVAKLNAQVRALFWR